MKLVAETGQGPKINPINGLFSNGNLTPFIPHLSRPPISAGKSLSFINPSFIGERFQHN